MRAIQPAPARAPMTPVVRRGAGNDSVLLWSACVVALCAGYYLAFGLLGSAIDLQHNQTERISAVALANAQTLAQRPVLLREERTLDERLRYLQLHADKSTTVARFIRAATRIVRTQRVRLVQIEESGAPTSVARPDARAGSPSGDEFAFEAIPLDVTLTGTYRALFATIGALAQAPLTMQIEIAAIERNTTATGNAGSTGDTLAAHLHIVLQRLPDRAPLASANDSLREDATTHARSL